MINATRKERTDAMLAVISEILLGGNGFDFNPLAVSVERPRIPVVGDDGETYWEEVGICRVVIEGAVDKNLAIHFEEFDGDEMDLIDEDDVDFGGDRPSPVLVEENDGTDNGSLQT